MSLYMSGNQRTFCVVLGIICFTVLIIMWSIMDYKSGILHEHDPQQITPQQACIDGGGVPLMDGFDVKDCQGLR